MKTLYKDLVEQTHTFPQEEFRVQDGNLMFHEIDLVDLVQRHGSPLKISYLPRISEQIHKTKSWFAEAMKKTDYQGKYSFAYCTKSAHFSFILEECLKNQVDLETSSAFDISIIQELKKQGKLPSSTNIICNGFKPDAYIQGIAELINSEDHKVTPIFDHKREPIELINYLEKPCPVGIRIASEEEPKFQFYTSRLGVRYREVVNLYREVISQFDLYELKMLHFFINTGINDTSYYWNELLKSVRVYCELKKICPTLDTLNIGGGFPIKNSLSFDFDYAYMIEEIIHQIKKV
ncbi:MAG: arginine decarboxylase, partial [Bacteroidota bacterium]|nr:arginine decarboxylase [Bacteroidota bacterium]